MTKTESTVASEPVRIKDLSVYWSLEKYHAAVRAGVFTPQDRIELINGNLVQKMSINTLHASCLKVLSKYFNRRYLDKYELMSENPITLPNDSEPEPDFTIVDLHPDDYHDRHPYPAEVRLVIEVSDSTLSYDQTHKAALYAVADLPEYWIINLRHRLIELHTEPLPQAGTYGNVRTFRPGERFESPFNGLTEVNDLLPRTAD